MSTLWTFELVAQLLEVSSCCPAVWPARLSLDLFVTPQQTAFFRHSCVSSFPSNMMMSSEVVCPGGTATPWVAAALRSWLSKTWGDSEERRALLTWPGRPKRHHHTLTAQPPTLTAALGAAQSTTCCAALLDKKRDRNSLSSFELLSLHFRSQE